MKFFGKTNKNELWIFKFFLLVYGIDVRQRPQDRKLRKLLIYICATICHAAFVFSIISFVLYTNNLFKPKSIKRIIAVKFKEISSILLWYSLYFKRHEITDLIENTFILGKEISVALPVRFIKIFVAWLVTDFIIGLLTYIYSGVTNTFYKYYFTLGYYDPSKPYTLFFYYTSLLIYLSTQSFHTSVCCFYTCLCYFLYKMLRKLTVTANGVLKAETLEDETTKVICGYYDKIINTLRNLEDALSRTVLVLLMTMFLSIFASLHTFVVSKTQYDVFGTPNSARHWFMFFQSMLNFLIICYFTILINETDKKMKMALKSFIKKGLFTSQNSFEFLRMTANDNPFTLSAWGFFHFTKSFLVAAFGSALTYMVLLVEL